jgi:Tfp pilus assembly protein FimT
MAVRRARSAYTLFEVLLVLAIIVIAAAMMVPTLDSMSGYHKMNASIDGVRGAWAVARSQAIEDSRPYRFAVSGGHYRVAPDDNQFFSGSLPDPDPNNPAYTHEGVLPGGMSFTANGQNKTTVPEDATDKSSSSGNWKTLSVFYPDGTASEDIELIFEIAGARTRTLRLRSLTGTIEVKTEGEEDKR